MLCAAVPPRAEGTVARVEEVKNQEPRTTSLKRATRRGAAYLSPFAFSLVQRHVHVQDKLLSFLGSSIKTQRRWPRPEGQQGVMQGMLGLAKTLFKTVITRISQDTL